MAFAAIHVRFSGVGVRILVHRVGTPVLLAGQECGVYRIAKLSTYVSRDLGAGGGGRYSHSCIRAEITRRSQ